MSSSSRDKKSSSSDSDSDTSQEHHTRGKNSVMIAQDPSKDNEVDAIFKRALELGATRIPPDNLPTSSPTSRTFSGTGRLLSGKIVPSDPTLQQPASLVHNIIFYRNGFTVNDGPLRRLDDPENASFLECIKASVCPKELEPVDKRSSVSVNLIKRGKNCPEPKKVKIIPFQGVGRTLGSSSSTSEASEKIIAEPRDTSPAPTIGLVVDESLPSTSIQLRLSDGTRVVAHFNYHHTIADIRSFIAASRPGAATTYQLQTVGFPPKVISDPTQTIEEAGLLNSVIIQKF